MANIFSLYGNIFIDNAKANSSIDDTTKGAKKAAGGVDDLAKEGEKTESRLGKAFQKVGQAAVAVGKVVATGIAVGATAMAGLTVKALNLSGELEQNMGGSEAVFKEYAGKMQETAKQAFSNMGLSTSDFLATANKMGALFQGSGFTIQESADMTGEAMQRAADIASIMGIDTTSAMEAIAGAAKGNFTMMDNLGVSMNDTAIKAYAMEKGIKTAGNEMTQQEKIGVAMQMFLDKTAYAAGNYAKENETLAGALGTTKAALTNFLDGSGDVDGLVKSLENFANVILGQLDELLPRLTNGITELVQKIIPKLPPILQKVLPTLIQTATTIIAGIVDVLPLVITAITDALPTLIAGFIQIMQTLVNALPQIIAPIIQALPTLIPQIINGIIQLLLTLLSNIMPILQPIFESLPSIIQSVIDALIQALPQIIQGLIGLVISIVQNLPMIIKSLIDSVPTIVTGIIEALVAALPQLIAGLVQLIVELVKAIPVIILALVEAIPTIIQAVIDGLITALPQLIAGCVTLVIELVKALPQIIFALIKAIPTIIMAIIEALWGVAQSLWDAFSGIFTKAWDGIKAVFSGVGNFFKGIWDSIVGVFKSVGNFFSDIFRGAVNGIQNAFSGIQNFFKGIFDAVVNIIKAPINFIIDGINMFLGFLNKIRIPDWVPGVGGFGFNFKMIKKLRIGLEYVPYDDMPALLHKGERVLTASEAKEYDSILNAIGNNNKQDDGPTTFEINIENFINNRKQDVRELVDEIMEIAEEKRRRREGVFT